LLLFLTPLLFVPLQPGLAVGLGVVSAAFALALSMAMLKHYLPPEVGHAPPSIQSSAWWKSALPMGLTQGMWILQGHLTILFLGLMATLHTVGIYRVAVSMALLVGVPATLFNVVGAPVIARLYAQGDTVRLQRLLTRFAAGMTLGTLCLSLPFFIAGSSLLSFVFGKEFSEANVVLLVLCGSAVINSFFGVNAALLNMTGHQSRVTRALFVSLVMLVVCTPLLIMVSGGVGAAIASLISMLVWNFLMWRDARHLLALDTALTVLLKSTIRNA
jgi:O-antigen/teichoic acid export membrane protein